MEKESRVGAELTTFGSKPVEELFFGNRTDIKDTWDDWTYNKLKTPRSYATERIEQLMPQFDLADEDIKALRTCCWAASGSAKSASVTKRIKDCVYSKWSKDAV